MISVNALLFHCLEIGQPGITPKKLIAQLPETISQEHPYLSLIPEQGPFHVCLNINEDVIKSHHIVFARLYKEVFGSDFPLKPKPF